jgi:hypothetical protein
VCIRLTGSLIVGLDGEPGVQKRPSRKGLQHQAMCMTMGVFDVGQQRGEPIVDQERRTEVWGVKTSFSTGHGHWPRKGACVDHCSTLAFSQHLPEPCYRRGMPFCEHVCARSVEYKDVWNLPSMQDLFSLAKFDSKLSFTRLTKCGCRARRNFLGRPSLSAPRRCRVIADNQWATHRLPDACLLLISLVGPTSP